VGTEKALADLRVVEFQVLQEAPPLEAADGFLRYAQALGDRSWISEPTSHCVPAEVGPRRAGGAGGVAARP
jgi:hypothetical protein